MLDPADLHQDERAFIFASARRERLRRRLIWGVVIGVILALLSALTVPAWLEHRRVSAEVDAELRLARSYHRLATDLDEIQRLDTDRALAAFDAGRRGAGEKLWSAVLDLRHKAELCYRAANQLAEHAWSKDNDRDDVRELTASVLLARAKLAEANFDFDARDELIERLHTYDDDSLLLAAWDRRASVTLNVPEGAVIEHGDILVPVVDGKAKLELRAGSTSLYVRLVDGRRLPWPILVARRSKADDRESPDLTFAPPGELPGFVYVPGGAFFYGSADPRQRRFLDTPPMHERRVRPFLIGKHEVTNADWIEFANTRPTLTMGGPSTLARDGKTWKLNMNIGGTVYQASWDQLLEYPGRTRHARQDWHQFPVLGVAAADAEAYARWRSSNGVPGARLCDELEWERAACGADDRRYPSGAELEDGNVDITYGDDRKAMGPDQAGAHPGSDSPFGVQDMAGNAYEWVKAETGYPAPFLLRGGSFYHDEKNAESSNRAAAPPASRDVFIGFRLCAPVPAPR